MIEGFSAHGAGVHAQTAADIPGNPLHPLKPAELRVARRISHFLEFHPHPGGDPAVAQLELPELAPGKMRHHPPDSPIADQQVRSPPHDHQRHFAFRAKPSQTGKPLLRFGLHPELRRAAHTQGGVLCQRLIQTRCPLAHQILDFLQERHIPGQQLHRLVDVSRP